MEMISLILRFCLKEVIDDASIRDMKARVLKNYFNRRGNVE